MWSRRSGEIGIGIDDGIAAREQAGGGAALGGTGVLRNARLHPGCIRGNGTET